MSLFNNDFCNNYNATLFYEITNAGAITSQYCEPELLTEVRELKLSLEDESHNNSPNSKDRGLTSDEIELVGRCISPSLMPTEIHLGRVYTLEYEVHTSRKIRRRCYVLPASTSRFGLESFFGDSIVVRVLTDA